MILENSYDKTFKITLMVSCILMLAHDLNKGNKNVHRFVLTENTEQNLQEQADQIFGFLNVTENDVFYYSIKSSNIEMKFVK